MDSKHGINFSSTADHIYKAAEMTPKNILRSLIGNTIKKRRPGSTVAYSLARHIVMAYENHDVNMETNGENWLQGKLGERGPVTAVDVGANKGEWAIGLLQRVKDCRVYCYEPIPSTFAELRQEVTDPRATLINKALSYQAATLSFNAAIDNPYISSIYDVKTWAPDTRIEKISVEAVTGDDEFSRLGLENLTIIKVDAEGHDAEVISGFTNTLAERRVEFIQFEYNAFTLLGKQSLRAFYEILGELYVICRLLPAGLEATGYHTNIDNFTQSNWVAVRNDIIDGELVAMFRMGVAHGLPGAALAKQLVNHPRIRGALGLE